MPTVPRYEQQTVGLNPVAIPHAQALGAEALGAGLGQGIQNTGGNLFKVAAVEQHWANAEKAKQDMAVVAGAQNELITGYDRTVNEAGQVTGRGVMKDHDEDGKPQQGAPDLYTQKTQEFTEWRKEIEKTLTPDQLALFVPDADKHSTALEKVLLSHQAKETNAWQKEQIASLAATQGQAMMNAPDEVSFNAGKADLYNTLQDFYVGHDEGFIKNEFDNKVRDIQTNRVKNAINRGDTAKARSIFDASVEDQTINPKSPEYAELTHRLNGVEATDKGTAYIASVWQTPKNNAPVMNATALYEDIDKAVQSKNLTPEAGKIAEAELSQRITRYDHDRTVAIHTFKSDLWQGIDDKAYNLKSALSKIDAAALPGDERVLLKKSVEHYFNPPVDPEVKMLQRLGQDSELATLQESISNGSLRITSLKDAQGYTERIGRANVEKLYRFGSGYEKALASPVMAPDQFKTEIEVLRQSGVDIPKAKAPEYKAMQGYVLDELVQRQVKVGKMLSVEDQKKEIRKIITEKVPVYMTSSIPFTSGLHVEDKAPWNVQNPSSIDVVGLLKKSLKRDPTAEEISAAQSELSKPRTTRQQSKTFTKYGGN